MLQNRFDENPFFFIDTKTENVKVSNDQEMKPSERDCHSRNGDGKNLNRQIGTDTKRTYRK